MQARLTVERRDGITRAMEVCLGLLPATILLLPFLLGGIGGLLIVLEGIATRTVSTAGSRLLILRMLGDLLLWGGAAVAGMFGLWLSVFYGPPGMFWEFPRYGSRDHHIPLKTIP